MNKKCVVIGLLGVHLDQPRKSRDRWATWRPTVAICQQEDLIVDRFELIVERRYSKLANQVIQDIETVSPETSVRAHPVTLKDPWDLEEVYAGLHQFSREYAFDTDAEDYLMHITTGTHVAQICLFLLTESRHLPGRLIQNVAATGTRPVKTSRSRLGSGDVPNHRLGSVPLRRTGQAFSAGTR